MAWQPILDVSEAQQANASNTWQPILTVPEAQQYLTPTPTAPTAEPAQSTGFFGFLSNLGSQIKDAFTGGLNQAENALETINKGATPSQAAQAGLSAEAGLTSAFFSPLAPITNLVGKAIEFVGNKLSETDTIKSLANNSSPEQQQSDAAVLSALQNLGAVAMGILGVKSGEVKLSDIPPEKLAEVSQHPEVIQAAQAVKDAAKPSIVEPKVPVPPEQVIIRHPEPPTSPVEPTLPLERPSVPTEAIPSAGSETSRVFERLKQEQPNLEGNATYEPIKLQEDARRAVDLIAKDKQKAFNLAMGAESSPDVTSTATNIALSEKALADGNYDLASRLIIKRSLDQTRRGQEIVSERGSVNDNSTSRYVKELIATRLDNLGKTYLSDLKIKQTSSKARATARIESEVQKVQNQIKNRKLDTKSALALLDKLTCV